MAYYGGLMSVDEVMTSDVVTVTGRVDLESGAESLVSVLRRVPGVVSVDSQLTWTREPGGD